MERNFYYIWDEDVQSMITLSGEKKYRIVLLHAIAWLAYMLLGTLQKVTQRPNLPINVADILLTQLPGIYVFYGSAFVFFRTLPSRRYIRLVFAEIVLFFSYVTLAYLIGYRIAPLLLASSTVPAFNAVRMLVASLWVFFNYSAFSFGYYFAFQSIRRQKELRIAEKKSMQAQQEMLMAEYSFLRSQINPHFLHNTLNFFYAKSLASSPELSDAILTLSEIMRYSLEQEDDNNGRVLLNREVDNLKKVIKINELRFSNRLNIDFSVTGSIEGVRIIPLVLITLLENAFKHGELINPNDPVRIRLCMDGGGGIHFSIHNRKKTGPKELGHGIGMDNIRRRLDYAYHENYRLVVTDEEQHYSVELTINKP
jgi:two-component system LytT family sensor kinase